MLEDFSKTAFFSSDTEYPLDMFMKSFLVKSKSLSNEKTLRRLEHYVRTTREWMLLTFFYRLFKEMIEVQGRDKCLSGAGGEKSSIF